MVIKQMKNVIKYNHIKLYIKQLGDIAESVNKINGKRRFIIVADVIYSTLRYGASPNNYLNFEFYNLDSAKRNTYVTHRISEKLIKNLNDNKYRDFLEEKVQFAERFSEYFGRGWLDIKNTSQEDFNKFMIDKGAIMCKPMNEGQGRGIEVLKTNDFKNLELMYKYMTMPENNFGIAEELITQHEDLSAIYSGSVNTVRIMTILKDNQCRILQAVITFGNGNPVANQRLGGIATPIEVDTGIIKKPAIDKLGNLYNNHPKSGKSIIGFYIPYWNDVITMVKEASKVVPQTSYIGWDIAITPIGPIIIEANTSPGYTKLQNPIHLENQIGVKSLYLEYLNI